MKFKFLAATLIAALMTGVVSADPPKAFEVTPGFKVEKGFSVVAPPLTVPMVPVAPEPKAKEKCVDCDDCKCGPDCGCAAKADPLWFAARVMVDNGNGTGSAGSGTPISCENGKTVFVTNAHVVPKNKASQPITITVSGRKFKAKYLDGSEVEFFTRSDGTHGCKVHGPDLAFLEVEGELGHVELADDIARPGDQVWQFGYGGVPLNYNGPTIKSGIVNKTTFVEPTLACDLQSISGDSGSGLFNTRGELVGVTWGGNSNPTVHECVAVELTTVRAFSKRPVLSKLFPRLAARAEVKREAKAAAEARAKLPPPLAKPPVVERKGPIDPKLAAPGKDAKPPAKGPAKATPDCPDGKCPTVPQAPYGSGIPPKPPGEGWQWDAAKKQWWKWSTPPNAAPPSFSLPPSYSLPPAGGCPNGRCPSPQVPSRRW